MSTSTDKENIVDMNEEKIEEPIKGKGKGKGRGKKETTSKKGKGKSKKSKAEEPKVEEESKVEEPKVEEHKVDESKVEEAKVDESKVDEESKVEEQKAEENLKVEEEPKPIPEPEPVPDQEDKKQETSNDSDEMKDDKKEESLSESKPEPPSKSSSKVVKAKKSPRRNDEKKLSESPKKKARTTSKQKSKPKKKKGKGNKMNDEEEEEEDDNKEFDEEGDEEENKGNDDDDDEFEKMLEEEDDPEDEDVEGKGYGHVLLFTRMPSEIRSKLVTGVKEIPDGHMTRNIKLATHVVCDEPVRTIKLMAAILRGIWVVSSKWVTDSIEAKKWLPETEYEIKEFPGVKASREAHAKAGATEQVNGLFSGMKFVIGHTDHTNPTKSEMKELVHAGDGQVLLMKEIDQAQYYLSCPSRLLLPQNLPATARIITQTDFFDAISNYTQPTSTPPPTAKQDTATTTSS